MKDLSQHDVVVVGSAIRAWAEGLPALLQWTRPMDIPQLYEICVEGHLADRWSDWFERLTIRNEANGNTLLIGVLVDQAALYGVLTKLHNLNLVLVSVQRSDYDGSQPA